MHGETSRRAGWWGLGPLLFGGGFTVMGVLLLVGSGAVGPGASGLVISGVTFLLIGIPSLALAWWIRRDIRSVDPPAAVPGELGAMADAELRVTGVRGHATVHAFKYLGGSSRDGTTLVQLDLEITTTVGGTIELTHRARVPLTVAKRLGTGSTVPVIVSSTDPSKLVIEWTRLVAPTA